MNGPLSCTILGFQSTLYISGVRGGVLTLPMQGYRVTYFPIVALQHDPTGDDYRKEERCQLLPTLILFTVVPMKGIVRPDAN